MPFDEGPEQYGDYDEVDPAAQSPEEADEREMHVAPQDAEHEQSEPQPDAEGYRPFDLAKARPSIFDPVKDSPESPLRDEEGNVLPEFDRRYRDDFTGLAFIGALSKEFEWLGHKFVIRTLNNDELLAAALVTKQWSGSIGEPLAYKTAMAALCVVSIDGDDLPLPVGAESGDYAWAFQRFNYAKARWFAFTIDAIHEQYLELEQRTAQVVEAMGKASGPTGSTSGLSTNSV